MVFFEILSTYMNNLIMLENEKYLLKRSLIFSMLGFLEP